MVNTKTFIFTEDLLHACETYVRIMEAKGVVVDKFVELIIRKNKERGYYDMGNP